MRVDDRHDPRFAALAHHGGYASAAEALGLMVHLWGWQTDRYTDAEPTYEVSDAIVIGIFGPRGPAALIAADLAERTPAGRLYIRGSREANGRGRTRIDWRYRLHEARASAGEAGGKQTGSKRRRKGRISAEPADSGGSESRSEATSKQKDSSSIYDLGSTSGTPALAPLALSPSGPRPRRKRAPAPDTPLDPAWSPTDSHRTRAAELGLDLDRELRLFRAHADTHQRRVASWNGAFTTWLERAASFRDNHSNQPRGASATDEMLRREGIFSP